MTQVQSQLFPNVGSLFEIKKVVVAELRTCLPKIVQCKHTHNTLVVLKGVISGLSLGQNKGQIFLPLHITNLRILMELWLIFFTLSSFFSVITKKQIGMKGAREK